MAGGPVQGLVGGHEIHPHVGEPPGQSAGPSQRRLGTALHVSRHEQVADVERSPCRGELQVACDHRPVRGHGAEAGRAGIVRSELQVRHDGMDRLQQQLQSLDGGVQVGDKHRRGPTCQHAQQSQQRLQMNAHLTPDEGDEAGHRAPPGGTGGGGPGDALHEPAHPLVVQECPAIRVVHERPLGTEGATQIAPAQEHHVGGNEIDLLPYLQHLVVDPGQSSGVTEPLLSGEPVHIAPVLARPTGPPQSSGLLQAGSPVGPFHVAAGAHVRSPI